MGGVICNSLVNFANCYIFPVGNQADCGGSARRGNESKKEIQTDILTQTNQKRN